MNILATIGKLETTILYSERPTVKVIIRKDNLILLLNNGLLPGGGIDPGESDSDAITRELQEELGATVKNVEQIGTVIQYRNFLGKKYIINGYTAILESTGGVVNPQDEGEANFTMQWLALEDALLFVEKAVEEAKIKPLDDDANQGKHYNLMTTYELLKTLK